MSNNSYPPNEGQDKVPDNDQTNDDADVAAAIERATQGENDVPPPPKVGEPNEELAAMNDRVLRLAAELENTRRRSEREKIDAGKYAISGFARDLLGVLDNFERALTAAGVSGDDIPEGRSEAFSGLVEGIKMTEKELVSILERHGVKRVFPSGEKFDPNLHQAVAQVPNNNIPSGHVVDVAQAGFTIGERILRAAIVTVSNGPDKNAPDAGSSVDTSA